MPKQQINLLPKEDFEKKPLGKFLIWALNIGRWIVVFTELIVILAFLSRFKLDQDLSDLYDKIREKQSIIAASASQEQIFRIAQKRISQTQRLIDNQIGVNKIFAELSKLTPSEITYKNLVFAENGLKITGTAISEASLGQFLANLSSSKILTQTTVANIAKGVGGETGIQFAVETKIKKK